MIRAKQHVFRERRNYNQWVNNETLEDYALRFTAKGARRWTPSGVANTAIGAISFLALEAIGGSITLSYGFDNAFVAILVVSLVIFLTGIPICFYAAKYGVDLDLLTRGASFGYIGSTITSLIYASFTFIFFALEAAIMAMALKIIFEIPLWLGYILCSIIVIPLVTHGITFISRFQLWTQPFWIILQILPFAFIIYNDASTITDWQQFQGLENNTPNTLNLVYFGAAAAVLFSLIAQIGEQVDYLRFLPEKTEENKSRWWIALICSGPGWVILGAIKILAGSFLAYIALQNGISASEAADPTRMYITAFSYVFQTPEVALAVAGIFVIICQLKINVTNSYAGSIAWSNFFSRLTHNHPGRVVWLVFNVIIALVLMQLGIYHTFESTLGVYAIVAISWFGTLVADLVINKPLKLSPAGIEFKRAYLHDINPVGVGSMLAASAIGFACYLDLFGETAKALTHFITMGSTLVISPLIALSTKGRFYIAREPVLLDQNKTILECSICQNTYEKEDLAYCPAYVGTICSLCCSLDGRCHDLCKEKKRFHDVIIDYLSQILPDPLTKILTKGLIQFSILLFSISCITGLLLWLVSVNAHSSNPIINAQINGILWSVFLIFFIISGVVSWLFVLAHQSSVVADQESQRQNKLLIEEIAAHDKTDKALQTAKEYAEAANNAKSRYLSGMSHEVRTPLNSILGYAQLLESDEDISITKRSQISVIRRSGEHLADLIEGMLDISSIEAGKLFLHRDQVRINIVLEQIVYMFRLQAEEKNLKFTFQQLSKIPEFVTTDEKRLRQILINLLSNAIKYTEQGEIIFSVSYKNQVARFQIIDTGVGIPESEMKRIFLPFERIKRPGVPAAKGTGLGLTITRLLIEILGGDLRIENNENGVGITANVSMMLSEILEPDKIQTPQRVYGYKGDQKTVVVVDDDPTHRGLIGDILTPLGFNVLEAHDGEACLTLNQELQPDIYFLDINMPGMDGWETANALRKQGYQDQIVMISANVDQDDQSIGDIQSTNRAAVSNGYIVKPIKVDTLLEKLSSALSLIWVYEPKRMDQKDRNHQLTLPSEGLPSPDKIQTLIELAEIGHLTGLKNYIQDIQVNDSVSTEFIDIMQHWVDEVNFDALIKALKATLDKSYQINIEPAISETQ